MNLKQIDRLVGAVPESIEEKSRRRLDGYAAVARRCEERIMALRGELERVQPRIDAWLRVSVGALSDEVQMGPVGEGPI